jgi:choline dehydrogenase-like flavoprotein
VNIISPKRSNNFNHTEYDVCIVGAGISGVTLALHLDKNIRVAIIEGGGFDPEEYFQELNDIDIAGHPIRKDFQNRLRQYGGATNIWAGRGMEMQEIDFMEREWIPYSGWPISHDEMIPFFKKTHKFINFPCRKYFDLDLWDGKFNTWEEDIALDGNIAPNISLWAKKSPRFNKGSEYYNKLMNCKNIDLYIKANVEMVEFGNDGNAKSVLIKKDVCNSYSLQAKIFVIATGGIENARILLNSTLDAQAPFKKNDNIGRYYMDHATNLVAGLPIKTDLPLSFTFGRPFSYGMAQMGYGLSYECQRLNHLTNPYVELLPKYSKSTELAFESMVRLGKWAFKRGYSGKRLNLKGVSIAKIPEIIYLLGPKTLLPHSLVRVYDKFSATLGKKINVDSLVLAGHCEQTPNYRSRVILKESRDRLGIRKASLDWRFNEIDLRSLEYLNKTIVSNLIKNKICDKDVMNHIDLKPKNMTDASHHMGTTRMSLNAKDGVVDSDCRFHGVDNLYASGSSVFPTGGHANPTLTIVALSIRLAETLNKNHLSR